MPPSRRLPASPRRGVGPRRGHLSPPRFLAAGQVAEDDLVDQLLDRSKVIRVDLAVVWRNPELALSQRTDGGVARERRCYKPQVVRDVADGDRVGRRVDD